MAVVQHLWMQATVKNDRRRRRSHFVVFSTAGCNCPEVLQRAALRLRSSTCEIVNAVKKKQQNKGTRRFNCLQVFIIYEQNQVQNFQTYFKQKLISVLWRRFRPKVFSKFCLTFSQLTRMFGQYMSVFYLLIKLKAANTLK